MLKQATVVSSRTGLIGKVKSRLGIYLIQSIITDYCRVREITFKRILNPLHHFDFTFRFMEERKELDTLVANVKNFTDNVLKPRNHTIVFLHTMFSQFLLR